MGFRFRKSISLGKGVRINLSKSGIGYSFGVKGARITKTAKGTTRTTIGIPGTGLSYSTETRSTKNKQTTHAANSNSTDTSIIYESNNNPEGSNAMKKNHSIKKILLWILALFFFFSFFIFVPSVAAYTSMLVALLVVPIQKWQDALGRIFRGKLKLLVTILLVFATISLAPDTSSTDASTSTPNPSTEVVSTTVTASLSPLSEATATPTSTIQPTTSETPTPTARPTATPTQTPKPTARPTATPTPNPNRSYILNTSSRKFHYPSCRGVKTMSEKNKKEYYGTREQLIQQGYSPCGICHP